MIIERADILYINMVDYGSTGNIMTQMSKAAQFAGYKTYCAIAGEKEKKSKKESIIISSYNTRRINEICDKLLSIRGYDSFFSTLLFLRKVNKIKPNIIHLHNLHSNYINLPLLFRYIKKKKIKTIWTLHDCWAFTGRCPHFVALSCEKWKNGCHDCEYPLNNYPVARHDRTSFMWKKKRKWFTGIDNLIIVTPSQWMANLVNQSFLNCYPVKVINNGIELTTFHYVDSNFRDKYGIFKDKYIVLGVAFKWTNKKGLDCFVELSKRLDKNTYTIVLVGIDESIESLLPKTIIAIHKTRNQEELAQIYSAADVFVNPTREDTFPTVNMESIACGTPVITFRTGGSPEIIDNTCGCVVDYEDIDSLEEKIIYICENHPYTKEMCIARSKKYDKNRLLHDYLKLYL